MSNMQDEFGPGKRYGKWTVISHVKWSSWLCKCDCGTIKETNRNRLRDGSSKSCGCNGLGNNGKKPDKYPIKECKRVHQIWRDMKTRCYNTNYKQYNNYGGRGIKVCDRWMKFENFYEDMGHPLADYTLDRIDNEKGYYLENCRWATMKVQQNNNRRCILVEYKNEILNLKQVWEKYAHPTVKYNIFHNRYRNLGYPLDICLNIPSEIGIGKKLC